MISIVTGGVVEAVKDFAVPSAETDVIPANTGVRLFFATASV